MKWLKSEYDVLKKIFKQDIFNFLLCFKNLIKTPTLKKK